MPNEKMFGEEFLEQVLEWIATNYELENIFDEEKLVAWANAVGHVTKGVGYVKERLVEELAEALKANMDWIRPPPTNKYSYDSVREDAWEKGKAALAKVEGATSD